MREVANWIDKDAPGFGGPNGQEAKLIGMEISGPTQCPSAYHCCCAGVRAFREAAAIWERGAGDVSGYQRG